MAPVVFTVIQPALPPIASTAGSSIDVSCFDQPPPVATREVFTGLFNCGCGCFNWPATGPLLLTEGCEDDDDEEEAGDDAVDADVDGSRPTTQGSFESA